MDTSWKIIHTLEKGYVVVEVEGKYDIMRLHNSGSYERVPCGRFDTDTAALAWAEKLINPPKHECRRESYDNSDILAGYGEAVEIVMETEDGKLVAENDEGLSSQVNYCPFCGEPAKAQLPLKVASP